MISIIKDKLYEAIIEHYGDVIAYEKIEVTPCMKKEFGHYQSNCALMLSSITSKKPLDVAKTLSKKLSNEHIFESVDPMKPGFINFRLDSTQLASYLLRIGKSKYLGIKPKNPSNIVVDFSSPNIAKELHVGHLRSTILGDSISKLFEFLGDNVLRLNHVGDWGTPFGILNAYIKSKEPDIKKSNISDLMRWYREAYDQFNTDSQFKTLAKQELVLLQKGNKDSKTLWNMVCDISRKAYSEIYKLLNVELIERGESFYHPYIAGMIEDLSKRGHLVTSQGAKCIFVDGITGKDGEPLPFILEKSDGGYTYATTDLAALKYRVNVDKASRIVVLTDIGQSLHFKLLFEIAKKVGYCDDSVLLEHVGFGLVMAPSGKKFKTRDGKTERLIDLIKEGILKASEIIKEKNSKLSPSEVKHLAKIMATNAIKYADLSTLIHKNYEFDYDKMLKFEGNTANFLLYSYVRIYGLYRELKADPSKLLDTKIVLDHESEIALAFHLQRFPEVIDRFSKTLYPNLLCDYLYKTAKLFNHFFRDCRIKDSPLAESRLAICEVCRRIMKQSFDILGIIAIEKM